MARSNIILLGDLLLILQYIIRVIELNIALVSVWRDSLRLISTEVVQLGQHSEE